MSTPTAREVLTDPKGYTPNCAVCGYYATKAGVLAARVEDALLILDRYRAPATSGCYDAALVVAEIQAALDGRKP